MLLLNDVIKKINYDLVVSGWYIESRMGSKEIWITHASRFVGFGGRTINIGDGLGKIRVSLITAGLVYITTDLVVHPTEPPDWLKNQPIVPGKLRPSVNGTIKYRTRDLNSVYQDVRKHLLRCGQAYLSPDGLGQGRACGTCPYQLHCVHLEDQIRTQEARNP